MITCIFGLTACGSEETYTDYEQRKMDTAIQIATQYVIPSLENFEDEAALESFSEYTAEDGYVHLSRQPFSWLSLPSFH